LDRMSFDGGYFEDIMSLIDDGRWFFGRMGLVDGVIGFDGGCFLNMMLFDGWCF
jgi:hypothetical protein